MMNILSDISGKIDDGTAAALVHAKAAAECMAIPFFIIGAAARDIFLKHVYGLPPHRATLDLDLGVSVGSWEEFFGFKTELVRNHDFKTTG
jgi:predicted nucleotidyltransferase